MKPIARPDRPFFGSGPTAKRPGWSLSGLEGAMLGRSHRDAVAKARINEVIERSRQVLGIPASQTVVLVMPVGYADRPAARKTRLPLEGRLHRDHW